MCLHSDMLYSTKATYMQQARWKHSFIGPVVCACAKYIIRGVSNIGNHITSWLYIASSPYTSYKYWAVGCMYHWLHIIPVVNWSMEVFCSYVPGWQYLLDTILDTPVFTWVNMSAGLDIRHAQSETRRASDKGGAYTWARSPSVLACDLTEKTGQ